jgi:aldose 1-epimerase
MTWTASVGEASVVVDAARGCRLASLVVGGRELLVVDPARGPLEWGCYPMAPFAGRVRHGRFSFDGATYELPCNFPPHAIHGTVFDAEWAAVDVGAFDAVWTIPLRAPWPFRGRVVQRVSLAADRVVLTLEVHADDGPMPASCGWHPWWRRPVSAAVDATAMWRRDPDGIPDGSLVPPPTIGPHDDCFTGLRSAPVLSFDGGGPTVTVESSCPNVVVFDEPADAVCVEPQTHPPDALNLGPAVVAPDRPLVAGVTFRWSAAGDG